MSASQLVGELTGPGGPFEIAEQEILGVRVRAYQTGPWTLREVFEDSSGHGDLDYLVYNGERYSFAETFAIVAALAQLLQSDYGIQKGDRVAIAMRNYPEFIFFFWATIVLGAIVVPLNAWWSKEELARALCDCGAKLLVADRERTERLASVIDSPDRSFVTIAVRSDATGPNIVAYSELRARLRQGASLPAVRIEPDDMASIMYTSGTTGNARGVVQSHRNHCTNVLNTMVLGSAGFTPRAAGADLPAPIATANPTAAAAHLPLFHIAAMANIYLSVVSGSKIVLMYKWDAEQAAELIETEGLTSFSGVPMHVQGLIEVAERSEHDLSSLRSVGFAGSAAPPAVLRRLRTLFEGRVVARAGYGMTEATSAVTFITGQEFWDFPTSVGRVIPINELRIVGASGEDVPPGEPGEVWVRGANIVRGYWNAPDATAAAFHEGWHLTGDIGRLDEEGRLFIVDRVKDIIIRAGENIYCGEIEAVLGDHPAVRECVVFGLPHPKLDEEVAAVVRLNRDGKATVGELQGHVARRLASFKVPSTIFFTTEDLPRNATGKILKRDVASQFAAQARGD